MSFLRAGIALCVSLVIVLGLACSSIGDQTRSAEEFVEWVYSRYSDDRPGAETLNRDAPNLFADDLLSLIRKDQHLARGEAGLLDFDPLCACQDWESLFLVELEILSKDKNTTNATATISNAGADVVLQLSLVRQREAWRIGDIGTRDVASLKDYLEMGLKNGRQAPN